MSSKSKLPPELRRKRSAPVTLAGTLAGIAALPAPTAEPVQSGSKAADVSPESDDKELLEEARKELAQLISDESIERTKMLDDLRFSTLDQWPADVRRARENDPNGSRPCLTIDKINQYIVQVVNDMRQNRPSIKARPVDDQGDVETAKVLQGLIRHIEDASNASVAYETAGESITRIGLGYFRILTDYTDDTSFDQEIKIGRIPNTFSVYLRRGAVPMPDGSDAQSGYVIESMSKDDFKRKYPGKKTEGAEFDDLGENPQWSSDEQITVCERYWKQYTAKTLVFLGDGRSMFEDAYNALPDDGMRPPVTGKRDVQSVQVKYIKMTGAEVIERSDWLGSYIPIIEVIGREAYVDGKRKVWGLVRPAKDTLRLNNYWMSAMTERMALAPKTPFIGAKGQFKGVEDKWKKANTENYAYLEYEPMDINGNAIPPPRRVDPAQIESGMMQMMTVIEHDVQTSLGMYKSALGQSDTSQQSGRAILALQKESDTGTLHFSDNLANSIRYAGKIIIDLIPKVYDQKRILRILGEDGQTQHAMIDPQQQQAVRKVRDGTGAIRSIYNLGVGKYDVTVSVGPSYTTARQEASAVLTDLANSAKDPVSANVMRYLAVKNSDFYGSDETIRMLKALLPPQLQNADNEQGQQPDPQAVAAMQKMTQQMNEMHANGQAMAQKLQAAESGQQEAMAKIQQQREADQSEAERQVWKAKLEAATKIEVAQINAKNALDQVAMQAESDADVELSTALKGEPGPNGEPPVQMRPLDKLAALHMQGMDQHAQSMGQIGQVFQQLFEAVQQMTALQQQTLQVQQATLAAFERPRTVSIGGIKKNGDGTITGANIRSSLN